MKKILITMGVCLMGMISYSQDSMNKKMDNKTDKMNKKMDNKLDPMSTKIPNVPDSAKRRAFPKRVDSTKRKTVPTPVKKNAIDR